jgi:[CysO sulfur-carrier protein]-S-L-cysteine hydrolase
MMELPRPLFEEMLAHARGDLPNEACGVIAGDQGKPVRIYPMRNAERSPVVYRFDEREQLRVFNEIEEKGWELLGLFHSHTHTGAYPSPTDRAQAHWQDPVTGEEVAAYPGTKYLILSLAEQDPVVRAFTFLEGEPVEEGVRIV